MHVFSGSMAIDKMSSALLYKAIYEAQSLSFLDHCRNRKKISGKMKICSEVTYGSDTYDDFSVIE